MEPLEAGLSLAQGGEEVCTGSPDDCQAVYLEPGKIYRVEALVVGDIGGPEALYDAIRSLYQQYPGVYINYVRLEEAGENGYRVVIEVFDPPVYGLFPWSIVAILLLVVAALVATYYTVREVRILVKEVAEAGKEAVEEITQHPEIGLPLAVLAVGVGAYLFSRAAGRRR